MRHLVGSMLLAAALILIVTPTPVLGQAEQRLRAGFWFNAGLGWGTADCESCADERVGGGVGALSLGGTLSQRLLLGASLNAWTHDEDDVTLTLGALTAAIRFYPWQHAHIYLTAGLGVSSREVETDTSLGTLSVSDNGTSALLGVGYDFRVGRNVSVTPFAHLVGLDFDGQGTGFSQVGLGVTVH